MGSTDLGNRLRQAREQAGMTQVSVCESLNIPKTQTLSAYERGVNSPPLETLKELSRLYGVSTDILLFGENNVPKKEKSKEYYVRQLVDAVDNLGLTFECSRDSYTREPYFKIQLTDSKYVELDKFAEKWIRLRNLLDTKTIEQDEYDGLISQRLNSLELTEISLPDDLGTNIYDPTDLPF